MRKNTFREPVRQLTFEQRGVMDYVLDEYAECLDQLNKMETFADPRLLAIAKTQLEGSMLWAKQAADRGDIR